MQNHIKEPADKIKKVTRTKHKKQNDDNYLGYLKSDISDTVKDFNSFMSVEAIGVRMAKLKNKLKYSNALAPSLRNLPDFNPTNPPYSIIKTNNNKDSNQKLDSKNKPTSSSKGIVFEDFKDNINSTSEFKNSNKNKVSSKKRKGDNLKKNVKKSKKSKSKDDVTNESSSNVNNEKEKLKLNEGSNSSIVNSDLNVVNTTTNNSLKIKTEINQPNDLQSIKNENDNKSVDYKKNGIFNDHCVSQNIDETNGSTKEQKLENNVNKKEINHKKINFIMDKKVIENTPLTTISNVQTDNLRNNINSGAIATPISNVLNTSNGTIINTVVSNPTYSQSPVVNSSVISNKTSPENVLPSGPYNNNILTKVYTKKPKNHRVNTQPSTIKLQSFSYGNSNIVNSQSFTNQNIKGTIYQNKLPQTELSQQSQQSIPVLREQVLQLKQQQKNHDTQQLNRMLQSHKQIHHPYLYTYNTTMNKRYTYPTTTQQQQQQQQIYYSTTKTSSYSMLANNSNQISNIATNNINTCIMNQVPDVNVNYNTLNSNKTFYNQKQYTSKPTVVNSIINMQINNNQSLALSPVNSINYISNPNLSLQTIAINTAGVNVNNKTLISQVNNQNTVYQTQLVQSPVQNVLNTSKLNTTPTLVSNKLLFNSVGTTDNKATSSIQGIGQLNSNGKIEEIIPTPELTSSKLPELVPTPELVSSRLPEIVPTPELTSSRLPEIVPTPELTSSRLPEIIPTPELTSSRLPELIPTPELASSRLQDIVPTPELTSSSFQKFIPNSELSTSKLNEIIPTPELSSSKLSEELLLSQANTNFISQINETTSKVKNQNTVNNIDYANLISTTANNTNFNTQTLMLPTEDTRYLSPILQNNTLTNIEDEKTIQTISNTINRKLSTNNIAQKIVDSNNSTIALNSTYNDDNVSLFQNTMIANNASSLQKDLMKLNNNLNIPVNNEINSINTISQSNEQGATTSNLSNINLSVVNPSDFLKDENESTINNEINTSTYSNSTLFPTPTICSKDTLPPLFTPMNNLDDSKDKGNYLYENITPPFSTNVSPVILSKGELLSDELTNSLNKVKANTWNDYINSPYIVDTLNQNNSLQFLEDTNKDEGSKDITDKKSYPLSLNETGDISKIPQSLDKNEQITKLMTSTNLNASVASTSSSNPMDLLNNINTTKNETSISNISPMMTHPNIFKQNRNDLYAMSMPLTVDTSNLNAVSSFQSPQYKSSVSLPLTPLSSRSISSYQQP